MCDNDVADGAAEALVAEVDDDDDENGDDDTDDLDIMLDSGDESANTAP